MLLVAGVCLSHMNFNQPHLAQIIFPNSAILRNNYISLLGVKWLMHTKENGVHNEARPVHCSLYNTVYFV